MNLQKMLMVSALGMIAGLQNVSINPSAMGLLPAQPQRQGRGRRQGPAPVRHTIGRTQTGEAARRLRQVKYRKKKAELRKKGISRSKAIRTARPLLAV